MDPDEAAHHELHHLELHCLQIQLVSFLVLLTLKCQTKIAADDILIFYFYLSKKIRLDFSCESSA